jgi:hypothetical protein
MVIRPEVLRLQGQYDMVAQLHHISAFFKQNPLLKQSENTQKLKE